MCCNGEFIVGLAFYNVSHSTMFLFQATLTDKLVGLLMILVAAGVFTYYTLWVIVLVSCYCVAVMV